MRLPKTISFAEGAAIPEAWLTAFQILELAQLQQNSNVVIYAAASGVGTAAIQICRLLKFNPFAVVSSKDKQELCMKLGAKAVLYKDNPSWAQQLIECNNGNRFNAVLDCVGAANVGQTIELLDIDGRWILYGLLSGGKLDMNLALLLGKRISIISTTLKSRTDTYKSDLISRFSATVLPHI